MRNQSRFSRGPAARRAAGRAAWVGVWLLAQSHAAELGPVDALGLRVARGFRVSLVAGPELVGDARALALTARGQIVVGGPGSIRTLLDANGDGVAEGALDFAPVGAQGLCCDGTDLYCLGEGGLWRFRDDNGDGAADGPPERLLSLETGEAGGHALRRGPNGWWYVITGNGVQFTPEHVSLAGSPIRRVEGGALLRLPPSWQGCEVIAHGFRNPRSFDFNLAGDLFAGDVESEGEWGLPWRLPGRLFHVALAGHHGWRLPAGGRAGGRADALVDAVPMAPLDRAAPTGVVVYRHYQFPAYCREGLFVGDGKFGRIYFTRLPPGGSSYSLAPEVFLESAGPQGFAPADLAVAPDGSLLVAGGGGARGGVYRVEYVAEGNRTRLASNWWAAAASEVDAVLTAPQPLEAWSRAWWVPRAARVDARRFAVVAQDNQAPPFWRLRAIEVLSELHAGLPQPLAGACAGATPALVRARTAWSLGHVPTEGTVPVLAALTTDAEAVVRRTALEGLLERAAQVSEAIRREAATANLDHADRRVRQAAARLAAALPDPAWQAFWAQAQRGSPQTRLTATLALLWRDLPPAVNAPAIEAALGALAQSNLPDHRLQALRLIVLALGDTPLAGAPADGCPGYEPGWSLQGQEALAFKVRRALLPVFPSGQSQVDLESSRLLAMLEAGEIAWPARLATMWTERSPPAADFHYLAVLARLKAPVPTNVTPRVAHALLALDRKLNNAMDAPRRDWSLRLAGVTQTLLHRDARLAEALLKHPQFVTPGHAGLALLLPPEARERAARLYLAAARKDPAFEWSGPLIELLGTLPPAETRAVWRQQWHQTALRDDLLLMLARAPEALDRGHFLAGLGSAQSQVVRASLLALLALPREPSGQTLLPAMRLLQRLIREPQEQSARAQTLLWVSLQSGETFKVTEQDTSPQALQRAYQPVFAWFRQRHPQWAARLEAHEAGGDAAAGARLPSVPGPQGNATRGQTLFRERGCRLCHTGPYALGPDLAGLANRLPATGVFESIFQPDRAVNAGHRAETFQLRDGQAHTGRVVGESAEGLFVLAGAGRTLTLKTADLVSRRPANGSLMPAGLLDGLQAQDLADLHAFLRTLGLPKP